MGSKANYTSDQHGYQRFAGGRDKTSHKWDSYQQPSWYYDWVVQTPTKKRSFKGLLELRDVRDQTAVINRMDRQMRNMGDFEEQSIASLSLHPKLLQDEDGTPPVSYIPFYSVAALASLNDFDFMLKYSHTYFNLHKAFKISHKECPYDDLYFGYQHKMESLLEERKAKLSVAASIIKDAYHTHRRKYQNLTHLKPMTPEKKDEYFEDECKKKLNCIKSCLECIEKECKSKIAYRNDKKSAEDRVTIRVRHLRDAYKQLSAAIVDETSFALLRASHFSNVRYYKRIMKEMNYMDDRGVLYLDVINELKLLRSKLWSEGKGITSIRRLFPEKLQEVQLLGFPINVRKEAAYFGKGEAQCYLNDTNAMGPFSTPKSTSTPKGPRRSDVIETTQTSPSATTFTQTTVKTAHGSSVPTKSAVNVSEVIPSF